MTENVGGFTFPDSTTIEARIALLVESRDFHKQTAAIMQNNIDCLILIQSAINRLLRERAGQ